MLFHIFIDFVFGFLNNLFAFTTYSLEPFGWQHILEALGDMVNRAHGLGWLFPVVEIYRALFALFVFLNVYLFGLIIKAVIRLIRGY